MIPETESLPRYAMSRPESNRPAAAQGVYVPVGSTLAQAERWIIEATLRHWRGNKSRAAEALGCSLKTLYNKLAIYQQRHNGAVD